MTYKKIAQLAGVSPSTVSKVMAGSSEISDETAERIRRLMKEYGCLPARYYKSKHADISRLRVAILVPEIHSVYYALHVSEIVRQLDSQNIVSNICITGFDNTKATSIIRFLSDEGMTDGIIAISIKIPDRNISIPIVFLTEVHTASNSCIYCDMQAGISDAIQHLIALGHKQIGFIGERHTQIKLEYFLQETGRHQLQTDERNIFISDKRFEMIGIEAVEHFLQNGYTATAFIAAYDEIAIGAIRRFQLAGIRIPEDISIIGINDIPLAGYAGIPLTTIRTFHEGISHAAVRYLLEQILHPESCLVHKEAIRPHLIIRQTTAAVPHAAQSSPACEK